MFSIVAGIPGNSDRFLHLGMNKISMATFPPTVDKACPLKL